MVDIAHIHPMLVHFPLALAPVAIGLQGFLLLRHKGLYDRACLPATALGLLGLAALLAIAAAAFGDLALEQALDSGVSLSAMEGHEELGKASAIVLTLLALAEGWLYRRKPTGRAVGWASWLAGVAVLILLLVTAGFGGHLVYDLGINVHPGA